MLDYVDKLWETDEARAFEAAMIVMPYLASKAPTLEKKLVTTLDFRQWSDAELEAVLESVGREDPPLLEAFGEPED